MPESRFWSDTTGLRLTITPTTVQTPPGTLLHEWLLNRDLTITAHKSCAVTSCEESCNVVNVCSFNSFNPVQIAHSTNLCIKHIGDFYDFVQELCGNLMMPLEGLFCSVCQRVYLIDTNELDDEGFESETYYCPMVHSRAIKHASFSSADTAPALSDMAAIFAKEYYHFTSNEYSYAEAAYTVNERRGSYRLDNTFPFRISAASNAIQAAWRAISQYRLAKDKVAVWRWEDMFINKDQAASCLARTLKQCSEGRIVEHGTNALRKLGILDIPKEAFGIEMEYEFPGSSIDDEDEDDEFPEDPVEYDDGDEDLSDEEIAERLCQRRRDIENRLAVTPYLGLAGTPYRSSMQPSSSLGTSARCPHCEDWFLMFQYRRSGQGTMDTRRKFVKFLYENHEAVRGQWIATFDGSLHHGVEIVSKPLSVEEYVPYLEALCGAASENGATTRCGVGMHVHLNREMFSSNVHIARFYDAFTRFKTFLEEWVGEERAPQLSGSADDAWATIDYKGFRTPLVKGAVCGGHYNAASLDGEYTVEVRIFQSCLVAKHAIEHVELLRAMVEWSRPGNSSIKSGADDFVTWVLEHRRKIYRHLCTRLLKFYSHYKKGIK